MIFQKGDFCSFNISIEVHFEHDSCIDDYDIDRLKELCTEYLKNNCVLRKEERDGCKENA